MDIAEVDREIAEKFELQLEAIRYDDVEEHDRLEAEMSRLWERRNELVEAMK
jgi:hypothetical protein